MQLSVLCVMLLASSSVAFNWQYNRNLTTGFIASNFTETGLSVRYTLPAHAGEIAYAYAIPIPTRYAKGTIYSVYFVGDLTEVTLNCMQANQNFITGITYSTSDHGTMGMECIGNYAMWNLEILNQLINTSVSGYISVSMRFENSTTSAEPCQVHTHTSYTVLFLCACAGFVVLLISTTACYIHSRRRRSATRAEFSRLVTYPHNQLYQQALPYSTASIPTGVPVHGLPQTQPKTAA